MSDVYPGRGTFAISTNGDPKDLHKIEQAVDAVIAEIRAKPVTADLFERGRKPTLERFADWRERNGTWIGIVDKAQTQPVRLQRFRDNEKQFKSITAEEVWLAAQKFLREDKSFTFRVLPQPAVGDVD
jgi:zinc protease